MPDRPNVLWITTDQQYAGAMSCAGNDYIDTPAMDRLAETGTRFTDAYCANPSCTPSRAGMLTGRMPSTVLGDESFVASPYREQSVGNLLGDTGYDCAYAGKWGGSDRDAIETEYGFTHLWGKNDLRLPEVCADFFAADRDRPFFLSANFDNPHNICEWSRDYTPPWGAVEDVPDEEYPPLPPNHAIPPYEPKAVRDFLDRSRYWSAMEGATPTEWREYRHAYYRLIEQADAGIGRILDALAVEGLAENTLVIFTADHGDGHGAHQLIQKILLYEEMVRVPLVVRPPDRPTGGEPCSELVSSGLDLLPTICDYAGVDPPGDLRGRSLRPLVTGDDPSDWREYVVTETVGPHRDGRMVRTDRYKYVVYHEGRHNEQLTDLDADPGEMVNLAKNASHADVLQAHRDRLLAWCHEMDDAFGARYHSDVPMIPGYAFQELWPQFTEEPPGKP